MKRAMQTMAAAILLFFVAAVLLPAQTRPETEAGNGIVTAAKSPAGTNTDFPAARFDHSGARAGDRGAAEVKNPWTPYRGGFFAPSCLFIMPVLILTVIFFFKHRRNKLMHETLRAMIEKGMPVTPELIASLKPRNDGQGHSTCYLLAGLILLGVGIGLMVTSGKPGLIPLLVGVAFLIVWQVEKRNQNDRQPPG